MFRFTTREIALVAVASIVTAIAMYALWQADRAVLALRLSQVQVRAMKAEGEAEELRMEFTHDRKTAQ